MKLNKMHLLAIVLLGLLIGSLGLVSSLGIKQDGFSNINKAAKNPDFVCREIPKKQPRDIELGHYAQTNDMTSCPKDNHIHSGLLPNETKKILSHAQDDSNNVGATTNMTEDQMLLAATLYADKKKNDPLTDDELKQYVASGSVDVSQMLNSDKKEGFSGSSLSPQQIADAVSKLRQNIANEQDPKAKEQGIKGIRYMLKLKELSENQEPAKADELQPWNKNKSKCSKYKANYGCLNIDTQNYNPINNERTGCNSLEGHRNRYTHQTTRNMVPHGRRQDYILKTQIVPPVCPKCPDCPQTKCPVCEEKKAKKEEEEVEDELENNELEDSPSDLARSNEKRKRTPDGQRHQNPAEYPTPGIKEAAERHEPKKKNKQSAGAKNKPAGRKGAGYPNEGAFSGSSSFPVPFLNSFSSFGR
ncbi:MAG: hypothetical protein H8E55_40945 [Pelagibacterales bacterium]|nr:hypothetical protein [Pelagibacterales bacterium]